MIAADFRVFSARSPHRQPDVVVCTLKRKFTEMSSTSGEDGAFFSHLPTRLPGVYTGTGKVPARRLWGDLA
jgi:hypothetical protein